MFERVKKSGKYHYLQIVENNKVKGQVKQWVIATVGRLDQLQVTLLLSSLYASSGGFGLGLTRPIYPMALKIPYRKEICRYF